MTSGRFAAPELQEYTYGISFESPGQGSFAGQFKGILFPLKLSLYFKTTLQRFWITLAVVLLLIGFVTRSCLISIRGRNENQGIN